MQADLVAEAVLREIISALRSYIEMQSVFLAEVSEGHRVVFLVETSGGNGLTEGRVDPRQSTLSHAILSGTVAEAVGDVDANPRAKEVRLCRELGIRSFVGVPVRLASGETFGVLCCFAADRDLEGEVLRRLSQGIARQTDGYRSFVNVSPDSIATGKCAKVLRPVIDRLVVEVLEKRLEGLEGGIRAALAETEVPISLAVDDFGVGYSNLARVLAVAPDFVKVDLSLIATRTQHGGR